MEGSAIVINIVLNNGRYFRYKRIMLTTVNIHLYAAFTRSIDVLQP